MGYPVLHITNVLYFKWGTKWDQNSLLPSGRFKTCFSPELLFVARAHSALVCYLPTLIFRTEQNKKSCKETRSGWSVNKISYVGNIEEATRAVCLISFISVQKTIRWILGCFHVSNRQMLTRLNQMLFTPIKTVRCSKKLNISFSLDVPRFLNIPLNLSYSKLNCDSHLIDLKASLVLVQQTGFPPPSLVLKCLFT